MLKKLFNNKKWVKPFIITFGFITILIIFLYFIIDKLWLEILAVTFLTTYYMSCIRPMVGYFINKKYQNRIDYSKKWFQEKKFERSLYQFIKVKKWKKFFPTYDLDAFNFKTNSLEQILGAMCQAEIVHEAMFILSFFPLVFIILFKTTIVFIITSTLCSLFEICFIVIQRYNRPRVYKLLKKSIQKGKK